MALVIISAIAGVLAAYLESRRREPTQHSYERYDMLAESMIEMRESMVRLEECYKVYPSAHYLSALEYEIKTRLDKLEEKSRREDRRRKREKAND